MILMIGATLINMNKAKRLSFLEKEIFLLWEDGSAEKIDYSDRSDNDWEEMLKSISSQVFNYKK
jgi:hypothetical protein